MAKITAEDIYNTLHNVRKPILNNLTIGVLVTKDKINKFGPSLLDGKQNVYGKHQLESCGPPELIACNSNNITDWKKLYERALTCVNRRIQSDANFISTQGKQPDEGHVRALKRAYYISSSCAGLLTKYASETIDNIEKKIDTQATVPRDFYRRVFQRLDQAQFNKNNRNDIIGDLDFLIVEDLPIIQTIVNDLAQKASQKVLQNSSQFPSLAAPAPAPAKVAAKAKANAAPEPAQAPAPVRAASPKGASPKGASPKVLTAKQLLLRSFFTQGKKQVAKKGGYRKQTKKNKLNQRARTRRHRS